MTAEANCWRTASVRWARSADTVAEDTPPPKETVILSATVPSSEKSGDKISHYKLLQQIGESGMGTVWMAESVTGRNLRIQIPIKGGMSRPSTDDGVTWRDLYELRKD